VIRRLLPLLAGLLLALFLAAPAGAHPAGDACPDGVPIDTSTFDPDYATDQVSIEFTLPQECGTTQVSIATYKTSGDASQGRQPLFASTSRTFTGGPDRHSISTTIPDCNYWAYLVFGPAQNDAAVYDSTDLLHQVHDLSVDACDEPPPSSSTTTTSTTTTTTTTTAPGDFEDHEACPDGDPANRIDPLGTGVRIEGETAVADFTIEPGCENVEVSLANRIVGRDGSKWGEIRTGRFDAGKHTLRVNLEPGCENQADIIMGRPAPNANILDLISAGRVSLGAADTTGDCNVSGGTRIVRPRNGGGGSGYLPFTGAGLTMPLLAAGLTFLTVGTLTVISGRRRGRRVAHKA
jgi:hypothetical protein